MCLMQRVEVMHNVVPHMKSIVLSHLHKCNKLLKSLDWASIKGRFSTIFSCRVCQRIGYLWHLVHIQGIKLCRLKTKIKNRPNRFFKKRNPSTNHNSKTWICNHKLKPQVIFKGTRGERGSSLLSCKLHTSLRPFYVSILSNPRLLLQKTLTLAVTLTLTDGFSNMCLRRVSFSLKLTLAFPI